MKVLILGDGDEELAWARWLVKQPEHLLDAAYPGFTDPSLGAIPAPRDLEDALARRGVEAVIVGGPPESRGEWLRRAAAEGLAIIVLHPPGPDSEAYYQVALSRDETGAAIVPYLPVRLHPGVLAIERAVATGELGTFRALSLEISSPTAPGMSLVRGEFARAVDVIRALVGEIDAITATGEPPGADPDSELIVHLRSAGALRAEVRIRSGPAAPARLMLTGSVILEIDPRHPEGASLVRSAGSPPAVPVDLPAWDPHEAILSVLAASMGRREARDLPSPSLLDGTRAMELSEAANRSLRRGRTVEMYYETISEEAAFKSVMTSTGCLVFLATLLVLPIAMAGPPLGLRWTLYIPYLIPPALILFILLQSLRLSIGRAGRPSKAMKQRPHQVGQAGTGPGSHPAGKLLG
jgi:myo-inositol 2-dehydrogenase/D-chiro-inositol 1-dehydrogenase